jgi:hypothetical protein
MLYNLKCWRGGGRYGCLYLNPSREPVQCAEILRLFSPARRVTRECWPARNSHSNVKICGRDCSDNTAGIPRHLRKAVTQKTKVQYPLSCLSTTSMEITVIEDKQNIFPLVGSGTFLHYGMVGPILAFLSRLLQHACQVTVLLFFVPLSSSGNMQAM